MTIKLRRKILPRAAPFFETNCSGKRPILMMKKRFVCLLPALALLLASSVAGRADQFSQIQNCPFTYWVPAPTPPPPGYMAGPPPFVHFFIGFHFH
jgi:hypothetical protein